MIVDLFAGPGGWDVAARRLGLDVTGFETDPATCATRSAAGLATVRQDVRTLSFGHTRIDGIIASPPCQEFSSSNRNRTGLESEAGKLTLEPLRLIRETNPVWAALEQVPQVLPIWRNVYGPALTELGYFWHTGILCAANFGVPQTRLRAVLVAHRMKRVTLPEPSHSPEPDMFGSGRWVTVADVLGNGDSEYHARVTHDSFVSVQPVTERWREGVVNTRRRPMPGTEQKRSVHWPAPTITGAPGQWVHDSPAGRVLVTRPELGALQSFPTNYPWQGTLQEQSQQIGNAVPPLLAEAVLSELIRSA